MYNNDSFNLRSTKTDIYLILFAKLFKRWLLNIFLTKTVLQIATEATVGTSLQIYFYWLSMSISQSTQINNKISRMKGKFYKSDDWRSIIIMVVRIIINCFLYYY